MTLQSMTGFGEGEVTTSGITVLCEVTSINRKQLDIQVNLPRQFLSFESIVQKEVRKFFSRGRISASIQIKDSISANPEIAVNHKLAKAYAEAFKSTAKKIGKESDINLGLILRQPNVINVKSKTSNTKALKNVLERALRKALRALKKMRIEEGLELEKDISKRFGDLEKIIELINKNAPKLVLSYRKKLIARINNLNEKANSEDDRILKEIAIFADRSDISEEIIRIFSHIKQSRSLLQLTNPAGRALDFLCQELFREINTIGSKSPDIKITKYVVKFKTELERIREQIQNIE